MPAGPSTQGTEPPILQRELQSYEQIAASPCIPSSGPKSLNFGISERNPVVLLYWLFQIHKLLLYLNLDENFNEASDIGWRNQVPKTKDRWLNP